MPDAETLEERVHAELLALRKSSTGVTADSIVRADAICQLLGAGDPRVAYTRLQHLILDSDLGKDIDAAAASLGLAVEGDTHLKRLDAFGAANWIDQRQVRRYSDKGVREVARLIATNWAVESVPVLSAIVIGRANGWELHVATRRLPVVEMRTPTITVLTGTEQQVVEPGWVSGASGGWQLSTSAEPILIADDIEPISVVIVWRGELWPKVDVEWRDLLAPAISESLGNKLMLRLRRQ